MLEYCAVAFNVAYVILAARRSIWCWPMGIVGSLLSIVLFLQVKIYAEAVLFVYYVVMGVYGWISWGKKKEDESFTVDKWPIARHIWMILGGYFGVLILFWFLNEFTDAAMPLLDSFTTIFSFIATYLVARKVLENWIYWIAIDSLTVYLYLARGLEVYAWLSLFYTAMAVYGYFTWHKFSKSTAT